MRIVCISDTHNGIARTPVPDGDVLLHAGDLTDRGTMVEVAEELSRLGRLPHRYKALVAGNHDFFLERCPALAAAFFPAGVTYLRDSWASLGGLGVWGSPWQPDLPSWAFHADRDRIIGRWNLIPEGLDVLVTHVPPRGVLDGGLGCEDLAAFVARRSPRVHVFGHVHGERGRLEKDGILYVNAACPDGGSPVVIDL